MIYRRRYIRRESRTRSRLNGQYRAQVEAWKAGKRCAFPGCACRKVDCHHTRGRAGALLRDQRFWVPLCRRHHNWVAENPARARDIGLLCQAGLWNTPERNDQTRTKGNEHGGNNEHRVG